MLSKQAEAWVLITQARESGKLKGFSFSTLERIGGTPCVLIGLASIKRSSKRDTVLRAIMRTSCAGPCWPSPTRTSWSAHGSSSPPASSLPLAQRHRAPPGPQASGEERAWGRRLAKRFGVETSAYDDRDFAATGDGTPPGASTTRASSPRRSRPTWLLLQGLDANRGDSLIAFGWAMAEDLAKLRSQASRLPAWT